MKTVQPMKWQLQSSVMERVSWRFQSAVVLGLVGLSSKIFLGRINVYVHAIYHSLRRIAS